MLILLVLELLGNNMEFVTEILNGIIQSFDFAFCIAVNILTYLVIKQFDKRKKKRLTTWQKRIVLIISILILGSIHYFGGTDIKIIANSVILAPVSWSWVFKPICALFNIDYKKFDVLD